MIPDFQNHRRVVVKLKNKSFKMNQMWKNYWKDLKHQRNVDMTFSCENKLIGAHRAVLFCVSKCFEVN